MINNEELKKGLEAMVLENADEQDTQRMKDNYLLTEANSLLKTLDIKGKNYVPVNERIKAFRFIYPRGQIITEIIGLEDGICTMKASVYDNEGRLLGTGHAQEKEGSTFINKTSFIENCETSCVGRALGNAGIGLDDGFASYEEVANAKLQQETESEYVNVYEWKLLNQMYTKEQIKEFYKKWGITNGKSITKQMYEEAKEEYDKKFKEEHPDKDFF